MQYKRPCLVLLERVPAWQPHVSGGVYGAPADGVQVRQRTAFAEPAAARILVPPILACAAAPLHRPPAVQQLLARRAGLTACTLTGAKRCLVCSHIAVRACPLKGWTALTSFLSGRARGAVGACLTPRRRLVGACLARQACSGAVSAAVCPPLPYVAACAVLAGPHARGVLVGFCWARRALPGQRAPTVELLLSFRTVVVAVFARRAARRALVLGDGAGITATSLCKPALDWLFPLPAIAFVAICCARQEVEKP
eukprot:3549095-Rhodomonas_salina.4